MKDLRDTWVALAALLLGFCVGYTVPRWIEHQDTSIQVTQLDRRTAENLERHIMLLPDKESQR